MTSPILLAFCPPADRDRVIEASFGFGGFYFAGDTIDLGKERLALLSIGPEGGAELAQWVEAHGLDGVTGIGFVGVTAPWAERQPARTCHLFNHDGSCGCLSTPLPLGSLEPLRAVAEMAQRGIECPNCDGMDGWTCGHCSEGRRFPLRLVLACAPGDGVCTWCGGKGEIAISESVDGFWNCDDCGGEGKALSSARVAEELIGAPVERTRIGNTHPQVFTSGGSSAILYPTRAEHGLRAVVERLTR